MTNTGTTRRLSAKQLTKALTEIDAQIAGLRVIAAQFAATFADTTAITSAVSDAWNATHDAIAQLEAHRAQVELHRGVPAGHGIDANTWALVQENRD